MGKYVLIKKIFLHKNDEIVIFFLLKKIPLDQEVYSCIRNMKIAIFSYLRKYIWIKKYILV